MAGAYSNGARTGEIGGQIGHLGAGVAESALDVDGEQAAQATEPRASASVSARLRPSRRAAMGAANAKARGADGGEPGSHERRRGGW
jgi:hypothetical protein